MKNAYIFYLMLFVCSTWEFQILLSQKCMPTKIEIFRSVYIVVYIFIYMCLYGSVICVGVWKICCFKYVSPKKSRKYACRYLAANIMSLSIRRMRFSLGAKSTAIRLHLHIVRQTTYRTHSIICSHSSHPAHHDRTHFHIKFVQYIRLPPSLSTTCTPAKVKMKQPYRLRLSLWLEEFDRMDRHVGDDCRLVG